MKTVKNGSATATATATGAVSKKSTKGIPRVTDKILAMDEAGRAAWLKEKTVGLSAEVVAEIKSRMDSALAGDRQPKKINFKAAFAGRAYAELEQIRIDLNAALVAAEQSEESRLNDIIAKAEQEKQKIAARKATEAESTATA